MVDLTDDDADEESTSSSAPADAQAINARARLVTTWQAKDLTGKSTAVERLAALEEMDEVYDRPGDNCTQFIGPVTVEGIQFTPSGGTLEHQVPREREWQWPEPLSSVRRL